MANGGLPHGVREHLLEAMRADVFADGKLPREERLARDMGVSRATIRAALQSLAEDGIVSRRRRHGTIINQSVLRGIVPLNRFVSFRELVEQSGHMCTSEPTMRSVVRCNPDVAGLIGIEPGDDCLLVGRLLRADGAPVVTVTDAVALPLLAFGVEDLTNEESTFAFIAHNTSTTVDHSVLEVVPAVAARAKPKHLSLPAGTPYAELREVLFSPTGDPVAFSRIAVDVRRIRLTVGRRKA
jgi:GntR family transcriptional regulator